MQPPAEDEGDQRADDGERKVAPVAERRAVSSREARHG